jgi:putative hydrolase of the HAD superfamily
MIKTIIFDFGNVIGFFDNRRGARRLAKETRIPESVWLEHVFDSELEADYESGRIRSKDFLHRLRELAGVDVPEPVLVDAFSDIFSPNAEVCALIPKLGHRYRLLLGSNTNELHARQFRKQFAETLDHFDELVLSFEVGARKPHRTFFEHCKQRARCLPDECVFIDDLHRNVEGARACGLNGIVYHEIGELLCHLGELGVTIDPA